jgi:ABC-type transport system substrate-binding protein
VSYAGFPILPAHVWGWTPDQADFDFSVMGSDDFGNNPTVSAGVFQFRERRTDAIVLEANTEWQGVEGVAPAGYIAVLVPDQVAQLERFLAGDLNIHTGPPVADRQRVREDSNVQVYEYPGNAWDYLGLNFASPDSPRTAEVAEDGTVTWVDADGNSYEAEEPHWLFGDVRVRRAIQLSLNMEEIMEKAVFGEGQQMASAQIPTSWATDPNLAPIPYDPEAALALFAEAGWTQNADGEMVNADGELFEFELITNVENPRRMQITEMIQAQLGEMGISVILNPLDFQQVLEIMDAQDFDAFVLGWREGFPDDPDQTQLFSASQDIVGGGSNNSSYYNPKVEELFAQALQVPGCRPEDRAPIYYEIQKIMQDDQAYVFLFAIDGMYAAQTSLNWGAGPLPAQPYWNVETWDVASN